MHSSSVEFWMHSGTAAFIKCSMISCRCLHLSFSWSVRAATLASFCWSLSTSLHASGELSFLRRWFSISRAQSCLSRCSRVHSRLVQPQKLTACTTRKYQVFPCRLEHLEQSIFHSLACCLLPSTMAFEGCFL